LEHTLEVILRALYTLSKDQPNRIIIKDLNCIPIFVRYHSLSPCNLQRSTIDILNELRNDRECSQIIDTLLGTRRIVDYLRQ